MAWTGTRDSSGVLHLERPTGTLARHNLACKVHRIACVAPRNDIAAMNEYTLSFNFAESGKLCIRWRCEVAALYWFVAVLA